MLNMKDMNTWINKDTFLIHMIIKKKYEANNRHIFVVTCLKLLSCLRFSLVISWGEVKVSLF